MKTYNNEKLGFEIKIPEAWSFATGRQESHAQGKDNVLIFQCGANEAFNIQSGPLTPEPPLSQTEDEFRRYAHSKGFTSLEIGRCIVEGSAHVWARYDMGNGAWTKKYMIVLDETEYAITATCFDKEEFTEKEKIWDAIVASFRLPRKEISIPKKEYLVKSFPTLMEWRDETSYSKSLHEADNQEKILPVYVIVSVDNYGLYISNITSKFKLGLFSPESNEDRYYLLSNNGANPFTIITPHYEIFYFLFSQRENFKLEWRPADKPGYSGLLPQNINQNSVEIVIVYGSVEDPNNKLQPIYRDPPLQLGLLVVNDKDEYDLEATCELYNAILAAKNSSYA